MVQECRPLLLDLEVLWAFYAAAAALLLSTNHFPHFCRWYFVATELGGTGAPTRTRALVGPLQPPRCVHVRLAFPQTHFNPWTCLCRSADPGFHCPMAGRATFRAEFSVLCVNTMACAPPPVLRALRAVGALGVAAWLGRRLWLGNRCPSPLFFLRGWARAVWVLMGPPKERDGSLVGLV